MKDAINDQEQVQFTSSTPPSNRCNQPSSRSTKRRGIVYFLLTTTLLFLLLGQKLKYSKEKAPMAFITKSQVELEQLKSNMLQNKVSQSKNGQIQIQFITNQQQKSNQKSQQIAPSTKTNLISTIYPLDKQKQQQNQNEIRQKGGKMGIKGSTVSLVNMLKAGSSNRKFGQAAYSPSQQKERIQFLKTRMGLVANPQVNEGLFMSMFNMQIDDSLLSYKQVLLPLEYQKANKLYHLDRYQEELPICVITPSYNNNRNFRIELNLNSIFTQNYSNYFVVIVDDASNDGSGAIFQKYLDFYDIPKDQYAFITNNKHEGALSNIYSAAKQYCSEDSIVMSIDGDDELIGKNVFKIFNAQYQILKGGVIYSNFYYYDQSQHKIMSGFTDEYPRAEKESNLYRYAPQRFSQLRSFRKVLLNAILEQDLKDEKGQFYSTASDMALFLPLLQLSCGKVYKIQGIHYLYNINTGQNDYLNRESQLQADHRIRKKKPYTCQSGLLTQSSPNA